MRRDRQRLLDIAEALDWVMMAIRGRSEAEFIADEMVHYAVAQRLTVVGEATARLTPELIAKDSSVPWADIIGLRNILVHQYFGVYWPLVWQTATDDVPIPRDRVAAILQAEFPDPA
jgi:uncharacterized protein with HEPN domain